MIPHLCLCSLCFPQSCNKSLVNQACSGPYWKNIGPRSFLYGPRCARSVLSRPRPIFSQYSPRAWLIRYIYCTFWPVRGSHGVGVKCTAAIFFLFCGGFKRNVNTRNVSFTNSLWQSISTADKYFNIVLQTLLQVRWNPDFTDLQGKQKSVRKIREFEKSGVKLQRLTKEGKRLLIQVIEIFENWGFEISGFYRLQA